ncbi:MAG: cyclopropane-fatty-acyl-phospholipid synthase family protein, partial [Phycisphaerae bacterium]
EFLAALRNSPIAIDTSTANTQHYELPTAFFAQVLGKHMKYSGCVWDENVESLDDAEEAALREISARAELSNGQRILELGCGWGSLTLWMAARYPQSQITAVSNSSSQREWIEAECQSRNLDNVRVITADMNDFQPSAQFDRIVSVEMFEHMRNYERLFRRIASWLMPDGRLFVHIFAHRSTPYLFESQGSHDWMSNHFFSGGIMPSYDLFASFSHDLTLVARWWRDGTHYEKTANAWLRNFDRNRSTIRRIFRQTYGPAQAERWLHRWRAFFMACAEMFGFKNGTEWGVAHYTFVRRSREC